MAARHGPHQRWSGDCTSLSPKVERTLPVGAGRVEHTARLPDVTQDVASGHFPDAVSAGAAQGDLFSQERDGRVLVPDCQPGTPRVPQAVTPAPCPAVPS